MKREMVIVLRHDLKRVARAIGKLIDDCDAIEFEIEREEKNELPQGMVKQAELR